MLAPLRRHKALTVLLALVLVLAVTTVGWVLYLNRQLGEIPRFPTSPAAPGVERPERQPGEAMTILLLGADDPDGPENGPTLESLLHGEWDPGAFRSDTIMVLHLNSDRSGGQLVSLPRDSWVAIPGHGEDKINAAFSLGGPALMHQTVEQVTGTFVDHVVVVDFEGFRDITRIVGGVEVEVPETVTDSMRDKVWTEGTHHIEGEEALDYVRQRYGLPGGDFDRMQRQQNFLRALLDKLTSTGVIANPQRVTSLAGELSDTIAVDDDLTNAKIRELLLSARDLRTSRLDFVTAPHDGTGMVGAASVVRLDVPSTRRMFDAITRGKWDAWLAENEADLLPEPGSVD